jgi:TetR/AcrR family hemagglutinin/protease transcriptional regulator
MNAMSAPATDRNEKRRRLPPEERRAQLLEVAIDVFAERGLGAARHAEIAERAGVAVSTVFAYFETREALVDAVLAGVADFFIEHAERVHGQEKGCVEILEELGSVFVNFLDARRSYAIVWLEWGSAVRQDVWPRYRAFTERIVGLTMRTLERGQRDGCVSMDADIESLARLFASSSQSIARLQLSDVDPATVERFQQTVLRAIVDEDALG